MPGDENEDRARRDDGQRRDRTAAAAASAEKRDTYLVTHVDADSALLRSLSDDQVHTLALGTDAEHDRDDLTVGEVLEATLAPIPPMAVTWDLVAVERRRSITVDRSPEPPTRQAREAAGEAGVGDVIVRERAGDGELHVLSVPDERTEDAAAEVLDDEATLVRAARMDAVTRVEVRAADGVVSVRYLP